MVRDHFSGVLSDLDRQVVDCVPPGGNWRDLPIDFASKRIQQIRESAIRGEGSRSTYYGRLRADRPSYTISTYFNRPGNGCFIHYDAPRLITVREAARLQGFPDSFAFSGEGRSRFVQVGNAVPPLLSFQVARLLPAGQVVDLFAGAGGLGLGFRWAGSKLVASVDNDASACRTHEANFPEGLTLQADLSVDSTHRETMAAIRDRLTDSMPLTLVGGPPCQGFSTAGDCRLDDPRNRLVFSFLRAVEALAPDTVLMENVPALMQRRGHGILSEVIGSLESLGYHTSVAVLHAEGYGLPQLRRRMFLMATRDPSSMRWPAPWRALMTPGNFARQPGLLAHCGAPAPVSVREAIGDLPSVSVERRDGEAEYAREPSSDYQQWARGLLPLDRFLPPPTVASGVQFDLR